MLFLKLKCLFVDWFLFNKLFNIDYYFDSNNIKIAKNDIYNELLWYKKPIKYWCSLNGLFEFITNIFYDNQIDFDINYTISRYYNINITTKDNRNVSNSYLWTYKKLNPFEKPDWTNDLNIKKELDFLENNYQKIHNLYNSRIDYMCVHPEQNTSVNKGTWKRIPILDVNGWNVKNEFIEELKKKCNIAYNHGLIFFSKTVPNTEIKEHYGSTNLRIRLHLGISVKDYTNTKLKVSDQILTWKENKVIAFDDSFLHSSYNNSEYERVVFIIDIFNPHLSKNECKILMNPIFQNLGKIR